jgi:predicted acylesterase/phospholipase RssA
MNRGGSLGAYEAGAYKAINEDLSAYFRTHGRRNEPIFHSVSGTSIGALNAALLVSYLKENKTGENDSHTISNKTFDFSKATIQQLIQAGFKETKEQMKEVLARIRSESSGTY